MQTFDSFLEKIKKFNEMYRIESNDTPTDLGRKRLIHFRDILLEEVKEADDIIADAATSEQALVEISDWLGDIIVYCASEARRWGLPLPKILDIIMESNFSKLDENGQPIMDERGKVLKGSNYWKPEPKIKKLLEN